MRLQPLRGQPLLHSRWGWLAGWIRDVALDARAGCVAAVEVELAPQPRRLWVAPFRLWRSRRTRDALEADADAWQPVERDCDWIGLDALDGLLVIEADGDWTARVADAEVDPETWAVQAYVLRRPWWQRLRQPRLTADQVVSGGADVLVVRGRPAARDAVVDDAGADDA